MKSLSKVLSLLLVICMLGTLTVSADEKVLSDIDPNTQVGKAVNELVSLNIIDGYTDGTFKPDNTVTRAEMAKLIVAFMRLDDIGLSSGTTGFADIDDTNHWSQPYVKIAIAKGIIVGYDDGTFRPDNPVKYTEAVKMVVCALGYGPVAQNRTPEGMPWYTGYISLAAEKGVLNGAATNKQEDPSSRGIVAILLDNALDVNVGDISTGKNGEVVVSAGEQTARDSYQQSEKLTGVVTAVYQTGLNKADTNLSKTLIQVKNGSTTETYRVNSNLDTYSLLGYRINANINKESNDDDYYKLESISKDSKNTVKEVKSDNIEQISSSGITFWESDEATKTTKMSFSSDMSVIYNGKYLSDYSEDDFNVKSGSIKLIDNNGNSDADVAFINSYKTVAIKNVGTDSSTGKRKIYSLYDEGDILIPSSGKFVKVTDSSGKLLDDPQKLSASKYDIANLLVSKNNEDKVFDLTITKKKVSGEITQIISDKRIAINNVEYDLAYNFIEYKDKPTLKLSSNINAYLDINGDIAAAEVSANSETSKVYTGYILNVTKEKGIDGRASIRLYGMENISGEKKYTLTSNRWKCYAKSYC